MKLSKRSLLLSSIILGSIVIGGSTGLTYYFNNKKTNEVVDNTSKLNPIEFNDNKDDIESSIIQTEPHVYDVNDWDYYDDNPTNKAYDEIYNSVNKDVIENDAKLFLLGLIGPDNNFQINISKIDIDSTQPRVINYHENKFDINIEFEIYNNDSRASIFKSNFFKNKVYKPYQVVNHQLTIENQSIIPEFWNSENNDYYANYFFKDVKWKEDNYERQFKELRMFDYSKTLNWKLKNISKANTVGYVDVKEDGQKALSQLSETEIVDDIVNKNDDILNTLSIVLDPAQNILQELQRNASTRIFISNIANDTKELLKSLIPLIDESLVGIENMIYDLLNNATVAEILSKNETFIKSLIDNMDNPIDLSVFIKDWSVEGLEKFLSTVLNDEALSDMVPPNLANDITSMGIVDLISV
ncbi:MAG: hypothetical protein ACRC4L_00055, partial [Mycoplasma sp.]